MVHPADIVFSRALIAKAPKRLRHPSRIVTGSGFETGSRHGVKARGIQAIERAKVDRIVEQHLDLSSQAGHVAACRPTS